ncbi:unnamed protein product [Calypogeia fissa]
MAGLQRRESIKLAIANIRRCSNLFIRVLLLACILAIAIFFSLAYPLLREENLHMILTGSSVISWGEDAVAVDYHSRDRENKPAGLNETFLAYAAADPNEEQEKRRIKMLLEGNNVQHGNPRSKWTHLRGMDHYVDIGQVRTRVRPRYETWMLQLQSPRYDSFWPRFRQLLRIWSRNKRHDPLVIPELMRTLKKSLDNFYNMQANAQGRIDHDGEERYRTCAVVGNSGILLSQNFGSFIDSHDVVIRLNNAKVTGFEQFVGSKTTVSFVNSNVYHDCSRRLNCFCHPYGTIPIVLYLCQVQHLMDMAFCEPHHNAPVLVTDPRFDTICTRLIKWYSVKNYVEVTGNPILRWAKDHNAIDFHYSSGLQAVVLALGICEKVDILGFGKATGAKHHYHTNQKAELSLHDYAAEYLFYDDLAHNRTSSIPFLSETGIRLPPVTIYR